MKQFLLASLFAIVFPIVSHTQNFTGPDEDIQALLANMKQFSQDFVDGDMEALVSAYTDNGKIMPTGKDIMSGKEELSKYWVRNPDVKTFYHKLTPLEIVVCGDRATDYGYYEGKTQYKDNPPSEWKGKYMILWEKVDGLWKIEVDIWNNINLPTIQDKMQMALDSVFASHEGAVGTVMHVESPDKELSWTSARGVSQRDSDIKLTPDQPVLVASNTKTYVSAATLRLVEMGKIKLDDPIESLIKKESKKLLSKAGYRLSDITLRHLLSHSSGITDYVDKAYFQFVVDNPKHRWTRAEQMKRAGTMKPSSEPGSEYAYADVNFVLLGEIIEEQTNQPFYEGIRTLLKFEELGINHTWFHTLEDIPSGTKSLAHQYVADKGFDSYNLDPSWDLYGGGGLAMTVSDLAMFFQHLFNGDIIKDASLLKEMSTPVLPLEKSNYCLGLFKLDFHGMEVYYHGGYWGTDVMYVPELNTTIAGFTLEKSQRGINAEVSQKVLKLLR